MCMHTVFCTMFWVLVGGKILSIGSVFWAPMAFLVFFILRSPRTVVLYLRGVAIRKGFILIVEYTQFSNDGTPDHHCISPKGRCFNMGTITNFYLKCIRSKKFISDLLASLKILVICNSLCARGYSDFYMVVKLLLQLCLLYLCSLLHSV